ncbi:WXG100 family type VII secretion target [Vallitalea guaymasensis]|uniref:ESAT-6-like protein n=1 Tax=Vallitalea guaymasensis TaxID=1185412 RepID=A0A8J8MA10_9FIRM|nr:WXG100 family type VII secretion target [Vallitalea guaymasensis]QUH29097.1 WXG100 family type VII secretion target [Vallitalea guaymasensis]
MSKSINVTPETLITQSKNVTTKVEEYETLYKKLISEVESLSSQWKGEGNSAYVTQITAFEPKFRSLQQVLNNYAEFLLKAAKVYRETEGNIVSNAKRLAK